MENKQNSSSEINDKVKNQVPLDKPSDMFTQAYEARKEAIMSREKRDTPSDTNPDLNIPVQTYEEKKRTEAIDHCLDAAERRKKYTKDALRVAKQNYSEEYAFLNIINCNRELRNNIIRMDGGEKLVSLIDESLLKINEAYTQFMHTKLQNFHHSMNTNKPFENDNYDLSIPKIRGFYRDLMILMYRYELTIQKVCSLLIEKRKWRKCFKKSLKTRKRIKQISRPNQKKLQSVIHHKNSNNKMDVELPNNSNICRISIPYAGYISTYLREYIPYPKREKFAEACEKYYEANGCIVYNVSINEMNVEVTVSRKNIDNRPMNIMDYYYEY